MTSIVEIQQIADGVLVLRSIQSVKRFGAPRIRIRHAAARSSSPSTTARNRSCAALSGPRHAARRHDAGAHLPHDLFPGARIAATLAGSRVVERRPARSRAAWPARVAADAGPASGTRGYRPVAEPQRLQQVPRRGAPRAQRHRWQSLPRYRRLRPASSAESSCPVVPASSLECCSHVITTHNTRAGADITRRDPVRQSPTQGGVLQSRVAFAAAGRSSPLGANDGWLSASVAGSVVGNVRPLSICTHARDAPSRPATS